MDTKALVTLCQKGNGQALSLLYENYSEKMLKVCLLNPEKRNVPLYKNDAFQKVQKRRVPEKR